MIYEEMENVFGYLTSIDEMLCVIFYVHKTKILLT